ncbi:PH domain-containing protein [Rhodococcus fascians]|uniref:PH domain-containing protein n=1 Tax=Rhodococcoides fascians TaxID=1828 RepID=UPI00050CF486|nr:PH domain-containing protein [Rhodococcus fascians]MBY4381958.1 PH domain-containing protein [Rhodococcus fascians]MBY4396807.1 PH domain-containing protein [Rhodococcus fascians]MBY4407245.1 PH domain-containing protein [Rhodococcus fascians]MBY4421585.1 PH domain-containing protein [Rhodococcus fascians]MBY4460662.1 PH domain-containing protein [Rhodococcus fascians]
MGYPQDALADEEELLLHRHPHWKMLILPSITFVLATGLAGVALGVAGARLESTAADVATIAALVVWAAIVGWRCLVPLVSWKCTHFIVTDRRVLVRQGVLTHSGIDIPMSRISNVQFRHGLLDRMLGTGTLIIASASDDPLEFDDIPQVQRVHSLLYQQVFDSMDFRRESVNDRDRAFEPMADDAPAESKPGWRAGKRR